MRIDEDVLVVLDNAETEGAALRLVGPQLERKMYLRVNEVLEAAGGKWNRKAKAHLFDGDAAEIIEQIILTGEITTRQEVGYFPTPAPVVARLLEIADLRPGMLVLEPSAGQGAIAHEVAKITAVDCVELLPANAEKITGARRVMCADFLTLEPKGDWMGYDRVVMNPPFTRQDDIRHVQHALRFLRSGGLLVSVMSAGIRFRDNRLTADFRAMLDKCNGSIEELPEGAFRESGTMVRAVIATLPTPIDTSRERVRAVDTPEDAAGQFSLDVMV